MPSWPGTARTDGDVAGRRWTEAWHDGGGGRRRAASPCRQLGRSHVPCPHLADRHLAGPRRVRGGVVHRGQHAGLRGGRARPEWQLPGRPPGAAAGRPAGRGHPRLAAGGEGRQRPPARPGLRSAHRVRGVREPGGGRPPEASPGGLTWRLLALPYGGRILLVAVTAPVLGARGAFFALLGGAVVALGYAIVSSRSRPDAARIERIVACRDDGLIATEIGLPVRGQLVPLPPALTGFAAVSVLAVLGLRQLPGFLLLAPVVAMLLAAVGSSHPHDGRLDWIVPVLLQAAQFGYVAAIGAASGVPGPLIFAVCAMIALHYADLAGHARRGTALGWEGRMIAAGAGAALGMATFAYLLLAAYLGVLICREIMTSWLPATEGDRR